MKSCKQTKKVKNFVKLAAFDDDTLFDEEWHREQYEDALERDREEEDLEDLEEKDPHLFVQKLLEDKNYEAIAEDPVLHEIAEDISVDYRTWKRLSYVPDLPEEQQNSFLNKIDQVKKDHYLSEEDAILYVLTEDRQSDLKIDIEEIHKERLKSEKEAREKNRIDFLLQEEDYDSIISDPELHQIAVEYSDAYRTWTRLLNVENLSEEEKKVFLDQVDFLKERFKLSEEKAIKQAIEGITAATQEKEEQPTSFIEEFQSYEELGTTVSSYYKGLTRQITNNNEKEAELLTRSFWNYTPPSVLRERFNIGVKTQPLQDLFNKIAGSFLENWSFLDNFLVKKVIPEEEELFSQAKEAIQDLYENSTRLIKEVQDFYALKGYSEELLQKDEINRNSFLETVEHLEKQINTLKSSSPKDAGFSNSLLFGLNDLLSRLSMLKAVLIEPKGRKVLAGDFTDWHNQQEGQDKAFDQFFNLILTYTSLVCASHLKDPSLANLEGVSNNLESLRTAVLYGIGFRDTVTKSERAFEQSYDEYDYERLANDPEYYNEVIPRIENPIRKRHVIQRVDNIKKWRTSINRESSVLAKIHDYLANIKDQSDPTCPSCKASRWSYEALEANSSSTFFQKHILPLIIQQQEVVEAKIEKPIQGDLLNDWRFNPFQAPGGIYAKGEGKYCGGLFNPEDADEIRNVLETIQSEDEFSLQELQAKLDELATTYDGVIPSSFLKEIREETPFKIVVDKESSEFVLQKDPTKNVQISWPDVSASEAQKNAELMKSFLQKSKDELTTIKTKLERGEEIPDLPNFRYTRKIYELTRPQLSRLERDYKDKLCFHPVQRKIKSLAHLIQQTVKGAIKGLKYISKSREQEQGLIWTCPKCEHLNKNTYIDLETYDIIKDSNSSFDLHCEQCGTVTSSQDISVQAPTQKKREKPLQSLQYSFDGDKGTLEDVISGETLHTVSEDEETEREQRTFRSQKVQQIVDLINTYGKSRTFTVQPSQSRLLRTKSVEMQFENLGEAFRDVFAVEDFERDFKTQSKSLLPVAYKLGLIFPFAVCLDCNTIHPKAFRDALPKCVHIERLEIRSTDTMNDVALKFKSATDLPQVHMPNFEEWKSSWAKSSTANLLGFIRTAQIDDDDFSLLGDLFDEVDDKEKEKKKEDLFEDLEETPSLLDETSLEQVSPDEESHGELFKGLDDEREEDEDFGGLFEGLDEEEDDKKDLGGLFEGLDDDEEDESQISQTETDLFDLEEVPQKSFEKKPFEIIAFNEALSVLDIKEKKKISGQNMKGYSVGDSVEDIPSEILTSLKQKFETETIRYIVESPLQVVEFLFKEVIKHIRENKEAIISQDEEEELFS